MLLLVLLLLAASGSQAQLQLQTWIPLNLSSPFTTDTTGLRVRKRRTEPSKKHGEQECGRPLEGDSA